MKYKKYLVFIVILMLLGINKIYAYTYEDGEKATCYYMNSDKSFKAIATFYSETNIDSFAGSSSKITGSVRVLVYEGKTVSKPGTIHNVSTDWTPLKAALFGGTKYTSYGVTAESITQMNNNYQNCPNYLLTGKFNTNSVILFNPPESTSNFSQGAQYGGKVDAETFWGIDLCGNGKDCILGEDVILTCDSHELFGDPNFEGGKDENGKEVPPSIAYIINKVLGIIRIIAILLLIVLGTIDIAKAVLAGKEDEMKKAQSTFIKRIIACVAVFLVPAFVRIMMSLTDLAWEGTGYESCQLEQITK